MVATATHIGTRPRTGASRSRAIAIGFIVYFVSGLVNGIAALWYNVGAGISLIIATLILVPIVTFLAIVVLRFLIEAVVALIAIAENTERTAENTRKGS